MAEWITFRVADRGLSIWFDRVTGAWCCNFPPMNGDNWHRMKATDEAKAQLEALHIVGEWAKGVAVEAAELRGRMVGAELNSEPATPGEG